MAFRAMYGDALAKVQEEKVFLVNTIYDFLCLAEEAKKQNIITTELILQDLVQVFTIITNQLSHPGAANILGATLLVTASKELLDDEISPKIKYIAFQFGDLSYVKSLPHKQDMAFDLVLALESFPQLSFREKLIDFASQGDAPNMGALSLKAIRLCAKDAHSEEGWRLHQHAAKEGVIQSQVICMYRFLSGNKRSALKMAFYPSEVEKHKTWFTPIAELKKANFEFNEAIKTFAMWPKFFSSLMGDFAETLKTKITQKCPVVLFIKVIEFIRSNPMTALDWLQAAAEVGNVNAQYVLAFLVAYHHLDILNKFDSPIALSHFEKDLSTRRKLIDLFLSDTAVCHFIKINYGNTRSLFFADQVLKEYKDHFEVSDDERTLALGVSLIGSKNNMETQEKKQKNIKMTMDIKLNFSIHEALRLGNLLDKKISQNIKNEEKKEEKPTISKTKAAKIKALRKKGEIKKMKKEQKMKREAEKARDRSARAEIDPVKTVTMSGSDIPERKEEKKEDALIPAVERKNNVEAKKEVTQESSPLPVQPHTDVSAPRPPEKIQTQCVFYSMPIQEDMRVNALYIDAINMLANIAKNAIDFNFIFEVIEKLLLCEVLIYKQIKASPASFEQQNKILLEHYKNNIVPALAMCCRSANYYCYYYATDMEMGLDQQNKYLRLLLDYDTRYENYLALIFLQDHRVSVASTLEKQKQCCQLKLHFIQELIARHKGCAGVEWSEIYNEEKNALCKLQEIEDIEKKQKAILTQTHPLRLFDQGPLVSSSSHDTLSNNRSRP